MEIVEDKIDGLEEAKMNLIKYKEDIALATSIELHSFRSLFDQLSSEWELLSNLQKIEILSYINSNQSDFSLEDVIADYKILNLGLDRPDINKVIEFSVAKYF